MKYRREIDGLRAIAVLPVILFHAGFETFSGGFVGVDVFFVISGYLITTLILNEREAGTFTIVGFYERRARRILPALFFILILCICFAWMWMLPQELADFSGSVASVPLFSSNILFWKQSGYFAPAVELFPLIHTWSLAVEEQFYLLFPLFIMLIWRYGRNVMFVAFVLVALASLFLADWAAYNHPAANFYLLPTRLWELMAGAIVAVYLLRKDADDTPALRLPPFMVQGMGMGGLLLITYAVLAFDRDTPFPSFYTLIPIIGTVLIIAFAQQNTVVERVLSHKLFVGVGLISYSAYLWHQPLFAFAKIRSLHEPSLQVMSALAVAALVLAYFSWKFVEQPFRDRKAVSRSRIFQGTAIFSVIFVTIGAAGTLGDGFGQRLTASGKSFDELGLAHRTLANLSLSKACVRTFTTADECRTSDVPEILLWGDSYAMHLVPGIVASTEEPKLVQMTKIYCGPLLGLAPTSRNWPVPWAEECIKFNDEVANWLKENKTIRYVVLASPFGQYFREDSRIVTSSGVQASTEEEIFKRFSETIEFVYEQGAIPVIFAPPATDGSNLGSCLSKAVQFDEQLEQCDFRFDEAPESRMLALSFLKKIDEKYRVVWFDGVTCPNGNCMTSIDGVFLYRDDGHLSNEGSVLLGKSMDFHGLITAD